MAFTDGYITDQPDGEDWQYSNTGERHGTVTNYFADAWARVRRFDANNGSIPGAQILEDGRFQEGPIVNFTDPTSLLTKAAAKPGERPWIVWAGVSPMSLREGLIVWNTDIVLLDKGGITGGEVVSTVGRLMIVKLESPISINGLQSVVINIAAGSVGVYRDPEADVCATESEIALGEPPDLEGFEDLEAYVPECTCIEVKYGNEESKGDPVPANDLEDGLVFCDMCNPDAQCGEKAVEGGLFAVNNAMVFPLRCTVPFVLLQLKVCDCCGGPGVTSTCEGAAPVWLASMVVFGTTLPTEVLPLDRLFEIYPCHIAKDLNDAGGIPATLREDIECCAFGEADIIGTSGPIVTIEGRWKGDGTRLPGYAGQTIKIIYRCVCDPCIEDPDCNGCGGGGEGVDDDCINLFYSDDAQCWVQEDIIKPLPRTAPVSFFDEMGVTTTTINVPAYYQTTAIPALQVVTITNIVTTAVQTITAISTHHTTSIWNVTSAPSVSATVVTTIPGETKSWLEIDTSKITVVTDLDKVTKEFAEITVLDKPASLFTFTDYATAAAVVAVSPSTTHFTFETIPVLTDTPQLITITDFKTDVKSVISDLGTTTLVVPVGDGGLVSTFSTTQLNNVPYDIQTGIINVITTTTPGAGTFTPITEATGVTYISSVPQIWPYFITTFAQTQSGAMINWIGSNIFNIPVVDYLTSSPVPINANNWSQFVGARLDTTSIQVVTDLATTTIEYAYGPKTATISATLSGAGAASLIVVVTDITTTSIVVATSQQTTMLTAQTFTAPDPLETATALLPTGSISRPLQLYTTIGLVANPYYWNGQYFYTTPPPAGTITIHQTFNSANNLNLGGVVAPTAFSSANLQFVDQLSTVAAGTALITAITSITTTPITQLSDVATNTIYAFAGASPIGTATVLTHNATGTITLVTDIATESITYVTNPATSTIYAFTADPAKSVIALTDVATGIITVATDTKSTTLNSDSGFIPTEDPNALRTAITWVSTLHTESINVVTSIDTITAPITSLGVEEIESVKLDDEEPWITVIQDIGAGEDLEVLKLGGDIKLITTTTPGCDRKYKFLNHDGDPLRTTSVGYSYEDCPPEELCGSIRQEVTGTHPLEVDCKNFIMLTGRWVNRPDNRAEDCPCYSRLPESEYECGEPSGTESGPIADVPTWNAGTTYSAGQRIKYNGVIYKSTINSNAGNQPDTSPLFWEIAYLAEPCTIRVQRLQRDWCKYCY